jgi:hypothetical protein
MNEWIKALRETTIPTNRSRIIKKKNKNNTKWKKKEH